MNNYGPWNGWSIYWLMWLLVGFLGPELYALKNNPQNTLSYQVWHMEAGGWTFAHYCLLAFCVWLFFHFVFGMFR